MLTVLVIHTFNPPKPVALSIQVDVVDVLVWFQTGNGMSPESIITKLYTIRWHEPCMYGVAQATHTQQKMYDVSYAHHTYIYCIIHQNQDSLITIKCHKPNVSLLK